MTIMGAFLKDPKNEKRGICPYCFDGFLIFDLDSHRIICEKCNYAIKLESRNSSNSNKIKLKILKNEVEEMVLLNYNL